MAQRNGQYVHSKGLLLRYHSGNNFALCDKEAGCNVRQSDNEQRMLELVKCSVSVDPEFMIQVSCLNYQE